MRHETAARPLDSIHLSARPPLALLSDLPAGGVEVLVLPEVRGWRVRTRAGSDIGVVSDLVVEPARRRLRYLAVRLHAAYVDDVDHQVLVPVGVARVDHGHDHVSVDTGAGSLLAAPAFRPERLDRMHERALLCCYGWRDPSPHDAAAIQDFYRGPFFDERPFLAGRRAAGAMPRRGEARSGGLSPAASHGR